MPPPDNCPDEIATLMQQTWNESPSSRPSFKVQYHHIWNNPLIFRILLKCFEAAGLRGDFKVWWLKEMAVIVFMMVSNKTLCDMCYVNTIK
jgi:hypothetical protein